MDLSKAKQAESLTEMEGHQFRKNPEIPMTPQTIDRLVNAIEQQSESMKYLLQRLIQSTEALDYKKVQPTIDKETAFWTAYQTLADEYDKEFQARYGDDLNTSLIFAGLFSAVSSAFIIQIQTQFQPDSNGPIQITLALLNQNGSSIPSQLSTDSNTAPSTLVVISQCLLYVSLFSTLMAALLAVLGKQWLLHYDSVGQRGTIIERGMDRQRKFDGIKQWNFELVMQSFPLLLQLALLLFAIALTIYLWTVHHALAAVSFLLTGLGFIVYMIMLGSTLVSTDSPFQTPLSYLLRAIVTQLPLVPFSRTSSVLSNAWRYIQTVYREVSQHWSAQVLPKLVPIFPIQAQDVLKQDFSEMTKSEPAVMWTMETTTDPILIEKAAALIPELAWSDGRNLLPMLKRLDETFRSCVYPEVLKLKDLSSCAMSCLNAFYALHLNATGSEKIRELWLLDRSQDQSFIMSWVYKCVPMSTIGLRLIAAQRPPERNIKLLLGKFTQAWNLSGNKHELFAEFLFCLNSSFTHTTTIDGAVQDKSAYIERLIVILFENLIRRLKDQSGLYLDIVHHIVDTIGLGKEIIRFPSNPEYLGAIYRFCSLPCVFKKTIG
ncbi:hypothetical protein R3P38DRAFT_3411301, partial [Favolaschia claudopus]